MAAQGTRPVTEQACERVREGFLEFLETFTLGGEGAESTSIHTDGSREPGSQPARYYISALREMAQRGTATLPVNFEHLQARETDHSAESVTRCPPLVGVTLFNRCLIFCEE